MRRLGLIAGLTATMLGSPSAAQIPLKAFTIPSDAMLPNLPAKSYLIVSFTAPIERGDVVVFRLPRDGKTPYIKRLIGLPGDRVQFKDGALYINGAAVKRETLGNATIGKQAFKRFRETLPNGVSYEIFDIAPDRDGDTTDVYEVPAGSYFFVGDNRDNSLDSRWSSQFGVGYVPKANIIGKMVWMVKGSGK